MLPSLVTTEPGLGSPLLQSRSQGSQVAAPFLQGGAGFSGESVFHPPLLGKLRVGIGIRTSYLCDSSNMMRS